MKYEGRSISITGSTRMIIKEAYKVYGFIDEDLWLKMLRDHNDLTHIYDGNQAKILVNKILNEYIPEFQIFDIALVEFYGETLKRC